MPGYVNTVNYFLSLATVVGDIVIAFLFIGLMLRKSGKHIAFFEDAIHALAPYAVRFAFVVASASVALSLYYSEIVGYAPCALCWWQRVLMYPQVIILGVALFRKGRDIVLPAIILSIMGVVMGAYNTFLQFGGSPLIPCGATGVSCAQRYFLEFGYVTIPTMSLTAFALILVFLLARKDDQ